MAGDARRRLVRGVEAETVTEPKYCALCNAELREGEPYARVSIGRNGQAAAEVTVGACISCLLAIDQVRKALGPFMGALKFFGVRNPDKL